jgi:cell wall-associated NlpC family hydrolase
VILGAQSLDDIISRLDAIERVSSQDAGILTTVKRYRKEVETRRANLQDAREDQARIVAEQAAQKQSIESKIAEQNELSRRSRTRSLEMRAEEARRQAALAAQAQAQAQARRRQRSPHSRRSRTSSTRPRSSRPMTRRRTTRTFRPRGTARSSGSRSSTSASRTCGAARAPSSGFDCSGFVAYVFAQVGVSLPHHAASQYGYGTPGPYDQLAPGDLVFFSGLGHVGIYIGGGQFVHAPHTGDVVRISSLAGHGSYVGARRL